MYKCLPLFTVLILRLHTVRLPSRIHGLHTYTHIPQDGCHFLLWCVFLPAWLWGEGRLAWGSGGLVLTQNSVCQHNLLVKEKHGKNICHPDVLTALSQAVLSHVYLMKCALARCRMQWKSSECIMVLWTEAMNVSFPQSLATGHENGF